jgi:hypothetical protein
MIVGGGILAINIGDQRLHSAVPVKDDHEPFKVNQRM